MEKEKMMQQLFASCLVVVLGFGLSPLQVFARDSAASIQTPKDIVLLLDNSGSLKNNDPDTLVKEAVKEFVNEVPDDTRIAILKFDQTATLLISLRSVMEGRRSFYAALDEIDYRGLFTNTPLGVKHAISELTTHGRPEATKSIVLLTDGIVDTGDKQRDREDTSWLREDLAADAASKEIGIFGIALGAESDPKLLQSLAKRTDADFLLASRPDEISDTLRQVRQSIGSRTLASKPHPQETLTTAERDPKSSEAAPGLPAEPPKESAPIAAEDTKDAKAPAIPASPAASSVSAGEVPAAQVQQADPRQTVDDASKSAQAAASPAPAVTTTDKQGVTIVYLLVVTNLLILFSAALAIVWALSRDKKKTQKKGVAERATFQEEDFLPEGALHDLSGITGQDTYELNSSIILIGRSHPTPESNIQHVVIDEPAIGRRHAVIQRKRNGYWLIDQNSKNGTFVNDQRIVDAVCLSHGDRVRFYNFEFEFSLSGMSLGVETVMVGSLKLASDNVSLAGDTTISSKVNESQIDLTVPKGLDSTRS